MYEEKDVDKLNKWRLMLGSFSDRQIDFGGGSLHYVEMEEVLDYLYSREYGDENGVRQEMGGKGGSNLTVNNWLNKIRKLFPKETVEILEKQALDKYQMTELLTDKEVLSKLTPNQELLKTILQLKPLMSHEVKSEARRIIKHVVDELMEKLEQSIRQSIVGRIDKSQNSPVKCSRNLDLKKTLVKNLKNYDKENRRLILEKVYFSARVKRYNTWRVIIAVDESGSMLDSVIHSAVMAGIFAALPMIDTRLIIFDTNIVDLSDHVDDPVETLMSISLGGGTDICSAVRYAESLMSYPERTIFVLISDLYEGGSLSGLYSASKDIIEAGAKMLVLTALDMQANPNYNRTAAVALSSLGAHVAAMTPGQLAEWVGGIIK